MMKKPLIRFCSTLVVLMGLCLPAVAALVNPDLPLPKPLDTTTQHRWDQLLSKVQSEDTIRAEAAESAAYLNQLPSAPLLNLWSQLQSDDRKLRVQSAWVILRDYIPGANPANWDQVKGFEGAEKRPRALMVIDALYQLWFDFQKMGQPEKLIAQELYQQFSASPTGMDTFIERAPLPVVQALIRLAAERNFQVRAMEAVGFLPIARQVQAKPITESYAVRLRMEYLDGDGKPARNGFYAWDRPNGRIYVIEGSSRKASPIVSQQ